MKYYLIGIKGAGMSTLAQILYDMGNEVVGYDDKKEYKFTEEGLIKRNIKIYNNSDYVPTNDFIVSASSAIPLNHKEIKKCENLGLKFQKYNELLGSITKKFTTIAVCGTHGKTTTSTLISNVLKNTIGCNYFIGDGTGFVDLKNNLFVIESCEYNKNFLAYYPTYTVITNIELEHTECYKDIDDIINTFGEFLNKTTNKIFACGDDENIRKIKTDKEIIYYGFNKNNDIYAQNINKTIEGISFDCIYKNNFYGHFELPLYGNHMVLNALACIGISIEQKIEPDLVFKILKNFKNAKRRFNVEEIDSNVIIDDYAHHPTEIKVTLDSCRQKYPNKKLVAIFKPNTYSRTIALKDDFVKSLRYADKVYITPIECNRENQADYPNVNSSIIIKEIKNAELLTDDTISKLLKYEDSVLCFMSCADISHLIENYKKIKTSN